MRISEFRARLAVARWHQLAYADPHRYADAYHHADLSNPCNSTIGLCSGAAVQLRTDS